MSATEGDADVTNTKKAEGNKLKCTDCGNLYSSKSAILLHVSFSQKP